MSSQEAYREFCKDKTDLPLFMQPFWLDLTCDPGDWDAVFSKDEEGNIRGAWAFRFGSKMGMRWIRLPELTPFTGIWIHVPAEFSSQKQITYRHEVLLDLERQLPPAHIIELKLQWTLQDWLPLYWKGYRQESRYTFRFAELNIDAIHEGFSNSFRRNLRAAERHYKVEVGQVSDLHALMGRVFEMRDVPVTISQEKLTQIVQVLQERNQCRIYAARDTQGVQAAVLIVWDATTSYYLIGGRHQTDSKNGINILLWRAIQDTARRKQAFDFEGSMIQGVNKFFQNFGAQLTPYHYIYKYRGLAKLKYISAT